MDETKQKVLQGMIDFMDELEGEGLKKHPKFMAAKVEVKPEDSLAAELKPEHEELESPEASEDEVDPEMLAKLMEMLQEK